MSEIVEGLPDEADWRRPADPAASGDAGQSGEQERLTDSLDVRDLVVEYGDYTAIHDLNLTIGPGEFVALTGSSGAGKSTLLWAMAGALPPTRGEVWYGEHRVRGREDAARAGMATIPQFNGLVNALTATENIIVPLLALRVPAAQARERASRWLAAVGLAESGNHLIEELSGGQQQRVAIARGLAQHPRVLLADEPTSDLDGLTRGRIMALLREAASTGTIVVMATHDPEAAADTDREYHLVDGWVGA